VQFPASNRTVLYEALCDQYKKTVTSKKTKDNLQQLQKNTSFTIVTGHQLNLFTGPLYFLYKIVSTINLSAQLQQKYPKYTFVPVYWMATEDHDFDEINYFNFKGKKLQWYTDASGAVGRLQTKGLDKVFQSLSEEIGNNTNANALKTLFETAYLKHDTLTDATRYIANALFGEYGLVIVDGDDQRLKKQLIPFAKKDILENLAFEKVTESVKKLNALAAGYPIQVNPREINYFYVKEGIRERIIAKNGGFQINETGISFSKEELVQELQNYPERFSPNVIARPLYQEIILPNLCYIGGGGEIGYWLELKEMFSAMNITFPMLLLRNSALIVTKKQSRKLEKLELSIEKKHLEEQFKNLYELAQLTDKSFLGAVKAQEIKQKKGLDKLEKRLLKAQKRKLKDQVVRMTELQNELFPNQSLQERNENFSELYLELGTALIPMLIKNLKPLKSEFLVLQY